MRCGIMGPRPTGAEANKEARTLKTRLLTVATIALFCAGLPVESLAADEEGRFLFGGSMRGRYEYFHFDEDATGNKKDPRGRIRYRLRFDGKITINPRAKFNFRFVSGDDSRSGNQTLGSPVDFGPNSIGIRYAMMTLTPWEKGTLPDGKGYWRFDFGRVKNSYVWKGHGKDMMLWDNDIAMSGTGTQFGRPLGSSLDIFFNTGYYAIDENSSQAGDPYMVPVQLGFLFGGGKTRAGIRGSYFHMDELDADFISRGVDGTNVDGSDGVTSSGGNVPDGLTGSATGGRLEVVETQAFLTFAAGSWPLTAFGGYSTNLSAEASEIYDDVGKNDVAYHVGIEVGDKKKVIKLGLAGYRIEANAFPSQFIDSDLLDGRTNRKGLLFYLSRRFMRNTDFNMQLFASEPVSTDADLEESVENSERTRLQVDLLYNF
jgi:hypothetical protein